MTVIRQQDVIQSVADALQFISYYHPEDFIVALRNAYEREESESAKQAMAQILINSVSAPQGIGPFVRIQVLLQYLLK